jgi:hypothetical protein
MAMGARPLALLLAGLALSSSEQPVPRIAADDGGALGRHFLARTPVVLQGAAARDVVAHWQLEALAARFPAEKVVVMTVPKGWRDNRATNQLHIDPKHIDTMREVRMPFADYAGLLARSSSGGVRAAEQEDAPAPPAAGRRQRRKLAAAATSASDPSSDDWDWDQQQVYVRHKMPSDHRGDVLGPALHRLLAADFPAETPTAESGTLQGVAAIAADGSLAVHDTKIRSGSAGLYYPAHSDCYHNMLLVMQGRRRVRLLDQSGLWRRRASPAARPTNDQQGPRNFQAMLRLKSLDNASVATALSRMERNPADKDGDGRGSDEAVAAAEVVWQTVLESGEALYIPPMWLHDVYYIEAGMGINQFYHSPPSRAQEAGAGAGGVALNGVQAEVQLCKYLKARLDQSRAPDAPRYCYLLLPPLPLLCWCYYSCYHSHTYRTGTQINHGLCAGRGSAKSVEQELGQEVG